MRFSTLFYFFQKLYLGPYDQAKTAREIFVFGEGIHEKHVPRSCWLQRHRVNDLADTVSAQSVDLAGKCQRSRYSRWLSEHMNFVLCSRISSREKSSWDRFCLLIGKKGRNTRDSVPLRCRIKVQPLSSTRWDKVQHCCLFYRIYTQLYFGLS